MAQRGTEQEMENDRWGEDGDTGREKGGSREKQEGKESLEAESDQGGPVKDQGEGEAPLLQA